MRPVGTSALAILVAAAGAPAPAPNTEHDACPALLDGHHLRIVCGYEDTKRVSELVVARGLRQCVNAQMTSTDDCW